MENNIEEKVIFLLDADAFFAGCHISLNDDLKDKALVVCSPNKHAIISTASYNARKFGVKSGMPLFKAKELCKNLVTVESNFKIYSDFSRKIFTFIFENFSKEVKIASIDECYIDATNSWKKFGSVRKSAEWLKSEIFKKFNLTVSIGISTNTFLAKMAVEFNKPNGIAFLLPNEIEQKLWPLPVKDIYGVGDVTEKILIDNNIKTIGDLAKSDFGFLKNLLGKRGAHLYNCSNGIDYREPWSNHEQNKSISNELTLNEPIYTEEEIDNILYALCEKICLRLKAQNLRALSVSSIHKYSNKYNKVVFVKKEHLKHTTSQVTLSDYTDDLEYIFSSSKECFYKSSNGDPISLLGVKVTKFVNTINYKKQSTINDIDYSFDFKKNNLDMIINNINSIYNKNILFKAKELDKANRENNNFLNFKDFDSHISHSEINEKVNRNNEND